MVLQKCPYTLQKMSGTSCRLNIAWKGLPSHCGVCSFRSVKEISGEGITPAMRVYKWENDRTDPNWELPTRCGIITLRSLCSMRTWNYPALRGLWMTAECQWVDVGITPAMLGVYSGNVVITDMGELPRNAGFILPRCVESSFYRFEYIFQFQERSSG